MVATHLRFAGPAPPSNTSELAQPLSIRPPYLRKSCDMKSGTKILLLGEKKRCYPFPEKTRSCVK